MKINRGDILFTNSAKPVAVQDVRNGGENIAVENNPGNVQQVGRNGLINGLSEKERYSFNEIMDALDKEQPQEGLDQLYSALNTLRAQGGNERLVRYIESELHFRMARSQRTPQGYSIRLDRMGY